MLAVKTKAPVFELPNEKGEMIKLSDFKGKKVVVYFYPKDNTPGCTKQACAFANSYDGFKEKNVVVIGISKDSMKSHQKFIDKFQLPFILLSDADIEVIQKYDVWKEKMLYGKSFMGVMRCTYIIDEEGYIEKVFEKAKPDTNAQEILEYLD